MPIDGAIVSYIKFDDNDLTDGGAEGPGFFIQNDANGPALFLESQQMTLPSNFQVGDVLDINVISGGVDSEITYVDQADLTRVGTLATVPAAQDLSNDSRFTSKIPDAGDWDIESELVTISGTVNGSFGNGGNGFESAPFETGVTGGNSKLKVRLPADVVDGLGIFDGCGLTVSNVPMWRFFNTPELTSWVVDDISGVSCPAVQVSVVPSDGTPNVPVSNNIILTFNAPMATSTVTAQSAPGACTGSVQVSTDGFATNNNCIGFAAPPYFASGDSTVATLVPSPALSYATTYTVKVVSGRQNGVVAQDGDALASDSVTTFTTAAPTGPTCTTVQNGALVISQVYGGGGNSGATYNTKFVELHNRSNSSISLTGLSLQYGASGSTSKIGSSTSNVAVLSGSVAAGGYFLVALQSGTNGANLPATPDQTASTVNPSGTNGKFALVNDTAAVNSVNCGNAKFLDLVLYGSAQCPDISVTAAGALSATTAAIRTNTACSDPNVGTNLDDSVTFTSTGAPNPHNASSPTNVCDCGLGSDTANGTQGEVNYCAIQFPTDAQTLSLSGQNSVPTSLTVYGQFLQLGVTGSSGTHANVKAQVGYGPVTVNPESQAGWSWTDAQYNASCTTCGGVNDEYFANFTPNAAGDYWYGFRVSIDNGGTWTYCDIDHNNTPSFEVTQLPALTVTQ